MWARGVTRPWKPSQINVGLTQGTTYVTQTCKKHMMDGDQQYEPSEVEISGTCDKKKNRVACTAAGTNY